MIFLTVGTQLPFDRLVLAMDAWAAAHSNEEVHAQIGPSKLQPRHLSWQHFLPPDEVEALTSASRLVVAHAGMGSVLTSLRFCRPLVLLPRKASLGEHRNEHQLATAQRLADTTGVRIAWEVEDLPGLLRADLQATPAPPLPRYAQGRLIARLRHFIAAP